MRHNGPNDNAFPTMSAIHGEAIRGHDGLTTREWFAGMALIGMLAACADETCTLFTPKDAAPKAFAYADAMIAQSAKQPQPVV